MMEEKYALELIGKGKRIDGRKFDEFRNCLLYTSDAADE